MKPPFIGLIAQEWSQSAYQVQATKLGIGIKTSNKEMSGSDLIEFAKECDLLYVDPAIISTSAIKTAEKSGIRIYPSSKTIEELAKITSHAFEGDQLSVLVTRSAHAQAASWPITLLTNDLCITPLPGISDETAQAIQISVLELAAEVGLVGGFELIVDAAEYKKLIGINWMTPTANYWNEIGSVTGFYEQNLRAVLDLPLGNTQLLSKYVVTGTLETDQNGDDYRPYLHLMARNPRLKFDQSIKQVGVTGDDLEELLTEIIHAQQYYSGKIIE
jgi:phosphoribosylaminoimidazole carboxylase (NCAIR synthetase)